MCPKFLIIAYYTENTSYQSLAEKLKKSIQNLGLPHYIESIKDQGSWEKNTHYKAYFIKKCLIERSENLLYVDVDAIFKSYPSLIDSLDCDIAYRTQDFRWRKDEALSGTIYLRNNDKIKLFVDRWIQINEKTPAERMKPETWEQKHMQTAQREMSDIVYYNLPPEYTYIFDHTKTMYPKISPVIEHYQESRNVHRNNLQSRGIIRKR
jgi:hypothetical protein